MEKCSALECLVESDEDGKGSSVRGSFNERDGNNRVVRCGAVVGGEGVCCCCCGSLGHSTPRDAVDIVKCNTSMPASHSLATSMFFSSGLKVVGQAPNVHGADVVVVVVGGGGVGGVGGVACYFGGEGGCGRGRKKCLIERKLSRGGG